jgi:hypothetical protein
MAFSKYLGVRAALASLGLHKLATAIVPYNPLFAAQQVAEQAVAKSKAVPGLMARWLTPETRLGLAAGAASGALGGAMGYFAEPEEGQSREHNALTSAALLAPMGFLTGYTIRKAPQVVLDELEPIVDKSVGYHNLYNDSAARSRVRGFHDAVNNARNAATAGITDPEVLNAIKNKQYAYKVTNPLFTKNKSGTLDDLLKDMSSSLNEVTGAPDLLKEHMSRGMAQLVKTPPLEREKLFLETLRRDMPGMSDRQLMGMLHPDKLVHQKGLPADPELLREAYNTLASGSKNVNEALDPFEKALQDEGRRIMQQRLDLLKEIQHNKQRTFVSQGTTQDLINRATRLE